MLKMITWGEYFIIMLMAYGLYYGWWLLKYYPGLKGMKLPVIGRKRSGIAESKEPRSAESEKPADEKPAESSIMEVAAAEPVEDVPVQANPVLQMELRTKLVIEVVRMAEKAVKEQWPAEKFEDPFRELLTKEPYCQLKGTHFEAKITQRIVEELTKGGFIQVDAERVNGWWV